MMTPLMLALLTGIVQESPALVGKLLGILHEQGHITAEEVASFVTSFDPGGGASFFVPKAP